MRPFKLCSSKKSRRGLHVERGATAACALHVGILELESRPFQGLDIVDDTSVQIHHRSSIDEHFQAIHVECLVNHSLDDLERHGQGEYATNAAKQSHHE